MIAVLVAWIFTALVFLYLELAVHLKRNLPLAPIARKTLGRPMPNLVLYEILGFFSVCVLVLLLFSDSLPTVNPVVLIFVGGLTLGGCVPVAATIYVLNYVRFKGYPTDPNMHNEDYYEAIKDMNPEEGIQYITGYITNPRYGCPPEHLGIFLQYLSQRNDEYGQLARKKLQEQSES
jgi:hypothetical protein